MLTRAAKQKGSVVEPSLNTSELTFLLLVADDKHKGLCLAVWSLVGVLSVIKTTIMEKA